MYNALPIPGGGLRPVRLNRTGRQRDAGRQEVAWEGRADTGRDVPSGVYFYRLEAGGYSETKRMVLVK